MLFESLGFKRMDVFVQGTLLKVGVHGKSFLVGRSGLFGLDGEFRRILELRGGAVDFGARVFRARGDDSAHALALSADDAALNGGAGVSKVVDDFLAAGEILFDTAFRAGELGLPGKRDRVALFVVDDGRGFGMDPFVGADLTFRVALLTELCGSSRDRGLTVTLRRQTQFEVGALQVHRSLRNDDVSGINGRLFDFVAVEAVGSNFNRLFAVARKCKCRG